MGKRPGREAELRAAPGSRGGTRETRTSAARGHQAGRAGSRCSEARGAETGRRARRTAAARYRATGTCAGRRTGRGDPGSAPSATGAGRSGQTGHRQLQPGADRDPAGQTFTVTLNVQNARDLFTAPIKIQYDPGRAA
ncbi:MAG: hypothetical protein IPM24_13565 [Bryobacterales bacterium]|nr:hypothetical protein [Bryobacterales bacterium]